MENYVTQTQFNDFASRVFLRFDQTDEKMDRQYGQLRSQIDSLGTRFDEMIPELREFKLEMRETNAGTDTRIASLDDRRKLPR